jgi:ankyrin repeat protein
MNPFKLSSPYSTLHERLRTEDKPDISAERTSSVLSENSKKEDDAHQIRNVTEAASSARSRERPDYLLAGETNNKKSERKTKNNEKTNAPLYWAARRGNEQKLKHHLDLGENPNTEFENCMYRWPLLAATKFGRTDCVEMLLRYGANPNITDSTGRTPLSHAILPGNEKPEICRALLSFGATPNAIYHHSTTVTEKVSRSRPTEIEGNKRAAYAIIREMCDLADEYSSDEHESIHHAYAMQDKG